MTIKPLKGLVSPEEWNMRVELAAAYRAAYLLGYEKAVLGHFSARVPGEPDAMLLNPFGLTFDEITASSLVKVNKKREILTPNGYDLNQAGFNLHSGILSADPSVNSALHVHTINGVAIGCQKNGFVPISQDAAFVHPYVRYVDYDGVVILPGEGEACVKALGKNGRICVLRNHGTLTVGGSIGEAFYYLYMFEKSCDELVASMKGADERTLISQKILEAIPAQQEVVFNGLKNAPGHANKNSMEEIFEGFVRRVRRASPDFET